MRYAKSKSKEGLIEEAIRIYQNVIDRFPKNKSALEGIKTLSGGIVAGEVSSEPKSNQLQPLIDLHHQHHYQSLLVEAAQMLRQFPKSANLYNILGIANAGLKLFDAALDCYKKAIKLNPSYTVIHNNIGNVLRDLGNLEGSIESYKKVIKLNPKSVESYYNLGKSFGDLGNLNCALDYYKQAIIINPNYTDAHYNMGRILHNKGDFVGALSCFKLTLTINPNYVEAYINMGFTFGEAGNLEAAVENYNKVIKIKPRNASAWDSLAFPLQTMKHLIPFENELLSRLPELTNSKYVQTERAILKYKLNLGTSDSENSLNQVLGFLSDTENIIIKNPKGSDKKYAQKNFELKKMVTLVHFGRSGTGLLHGLIDGHEEVSTLPSRYLNEFFGRSSWENIIEDGWSNAVERFITIYGALFDASLAELTNTKDQKFNDSVFESKEIKAVSEQKNEVLNADKTKFGNELNRLMETYDQIDAFIFFKLVHIAYNKSISDHNYKSLIFYHIHNPSIYAQLNFLRWVPKANWVMMVREPLQSCESWITKYFFDNDYTQVSLRIVTMLFEIDKIIYHQHKSIGVRLEDLKEHPKKTIRALCSWMDIEETETLYQIGSHSHKLGTSVNSDLKSHVKDPFGKASINRQVGSIFSENDQYILRTLFYPFSVRFGYVKESFEQFKMDLQSIRPMLDQMFDFEKKL